ncbi:unnamed protein product [Cladocopium goreaui]|uniref:Uncharacterized protein n=1 Tax=Cladocopium goreaui TaxID=2562237 RepID=A0A9P1DPH2_9DINO|nr:unnamed protein product [Cladocopium goreaui]
MGSCGVEEQEKEEIDVGVRAEEQPLPVPNRGLPHGLSFAAPAPCCVAAAVVAVAAAPPVTAVAAAATERRLRAAAGARVQSALNEQHHTLELRAKQPQRPVEISNDKLFRYLDRLEEELDLQMEALDMRLVILK